MKRVIHKIMYDYEKEEKWLNEMAVKGWNLIDYGFARYLFEEGKPGEYIYRIELLKQHHRNPESEAYIRFMDGLGIECVAGYLKWVYFRKKASDGAFDLFSDYDSKIEHYSRVHRFIVAGVCVNLLAAFLNLGLSFGLYPDIFDSINLYAGCFSLTVSAILAKLFFSYGQKMKNLKADRQLRE